MITLELQGASRSDEGVPATALSTMVRTAAACARLFLRNRILEFPDALLAVFLFIESHMAQVNICSMLTDLSHQPNHLFTPGRPLRTIF